MNLKTISEVKDLKNKKVLLRVDFNVPLNKETGEVKDDTRILESLETIKFLLDQKAKVIIASHLGRPKGKVVSELKMDMVAKKLSELIDNKIYKADEIVGEEVKKLISEMKGGEIVMLENLRFNSGEKECDPEFSKELAELAELFVNDAFGTAHRKHASTFGVSERLPSYAGFLMEKEIKALSPILSDDLPKPVTMIIGGAKIDTKIGLIKSFIDKVDYFLIGGALANTFLEAAGYDIAESKHQEDKVDLAREIMLEVEKHHEKFILPHDVVVASELGNDVEKLDIPIEDVMGDMKILDIGKWTAEKYANIVSESGTVIWNGPLGVCEYEPFRNGTRSVARTLADCKCTSIIGGGDTIDAIKNCNIPAESFTHISTGGGACIEFLEGKELPAIKALTK